MLGVSRFMLRHRGGGYWLATAPLAAALRGTPGVAHTIPVAGHGAAGAGEAAAGAATPRKEQ